MKVKVIGCSTCWTDRPTSSYCLNDNILIDSGEGTMKYYKRCGVDFLKIKHIFITHLHIDHTSNLMQFLSQYMIYESENRKKFLTIYGPTGLVKFLYDMRDLYSMDLKDKRIEDYINLVEITDFDKKLYVEGLEITTFKLVHGIFENIAYIFFDGKTNLGFSGDCRYDELTENFVSKTDVCFLECCSDVSSDCHLGYDKFKMLQDKFSDKRFIAIHCVDKIFNRADELGIEITDCGYEYEF